MKTIIITTENGPITTPVAITIKNEADQATFDRCFGYMRDCGYEPTIVTEEPSITITADAMDDTYDLGRDD